MFKNSNFDKTPTFSRVFHPKFYWQFFSSNQSCQQLKSPKPQQFHDFFTPKIDNFLWKSKLNFWTRNEAFEQCEVGRSSWHCAKLNFASCGLLIVCLWSWYYKGKDDQIGERERDYCLIIILIDRLLPPCQIHKKTSFSQDFHRIVL